MLTLLTVMVAPLMLGSFRPRFWYSLETAVFVLFSLFCMSQALLPRPQVFRDFKPIYLLLAGWLFWPLIQLIPLPQPLISIVSTRADHIAQLAQPGLYFLSISVQKFSTAEEFLKRLMYVSMFTMMLYLPVRRGHLIWALLIIAAFALLHGIYVLLQYTADPAINIKSTYTNRNHFALYIAMSLSVMIGLCLTFLKGTANRGTYIWLNGGLLGVCGVILILVTVLMFTQSKGATVSILVGMVLTWALLRDKNPRTTISGHYIFWIMLGVAVISMVILGVSDLFSRFNIADIFGDERWLQWGDSLRLATDYWLTGSGAGTYEYVFPAYKSAEYRPLIYHHVHNDYIETLSNEGLIGLALLLGIFVKWLATVRRLYLGRHDPFLKGVTFGIYLAVTTGMVHGFFDFNLQVPANVLMLFVLMGLGLATITLNRRPHGRVEA